jgi:hypothetical protein
MSHVIYSEQQLVAKSISDLKTIYTQLGCTLEVADKRIKASWVQAIVNHQSTQIQAVAQAELDVYIEQQAQEIVPEQVEFICIDGFYNYEAQAGGEVIATITHDTDDFVTQRWVVMVGQAEVHRADTQTKCESYIRWHYKNGTLPSFEQQEQQPDIGNAVIAQRSESCDQAEIDAVPDSDFGNLYRVWQGTRILGTFYESMSGDWVARSSGSTESWYCSSPEDAMHRILEHTSNTTQTTYREIPPQVYETTLITELLDKPFDELTPCEWRIIQAYEPQNELAVA